METVLWIAGWVIKIYAGLFVGAIATCLGIFLAMCLIALIALSIASPILWLLKKVCGD